MDIRVVSWDAVSPELRAIIEEVCTPKQIDAVKLKAAGIVDARDRQGTRHRPGRCTRTARARLPAHPGRADDLGALQ